MAQPPNVPITLGHNNPQALQTPQALLNADVDPPTGQFKVRVMRQNTVAAVTPLRVHWWALRPERHLGQVTVGPGVIVTLNLTQVTLNTSTQQQFTATVTGSANTAVTWSVNNVVGGNATVGTITTTGLYTAPTAVPTPATVTVRATSVADATRSATATVTVQAQVVVAVAPTTVPVPAEVQQQFTATVTGTANTAVTWSVNNVTGGNATVGAITTNGLYTAPAVTVSTSVTIRATSVADAAKNATAAVTVQPPVVVTMSPTTAAVNLGATRQFSATVSGASNTAVTWSVTPGLGTVSATGLYTAPAARSTPASGAVTATSQADPSKNASATVTIPPVSVTGSPSFATLDPGGQRQFSATVTNATNTAVTWSIPDGGSVTPGGSYTAPSGAGTYRVIATSNADSTKSFTANVTVAVAKGKEDKESEKRKEEKDFSKGKGGKEQQDFKGGDNPLLDTLLDPSAEAPHQLAEGSTSESRRSGGQALIRPEERPEVKG
jgi:hypothetical protein